MKKVNLTINGKKVQISEKYNIWQAAKSLNINIPALCYLDGFSHSSSCMVCMVWDNIEKKPIPSCSSKVNEGMNINTENEQIYNIRKSSLEFLLAEHIGDCSAPCQFICPAHPDIPKMIREIRSGEIEEAYKTIKKELILPAVLGYICSAPCQNGCRRDQYDTGISISMLHRVIAIDNLKNNFNKMYTLKPKTGKKLPL